MAADEGHALDTSDRTEAIAAPELTSSDIPVSRWASHRLRWLVNWGTKGALAVVDQALFAGAQFGLNVLLARWLDPDGYGAFAVAYAVFLLIAAVHTAVLIEPMIVFGSGKYFSDQRLYLGVVLRGHWLLTIPAGLALLTAGGLIARFYSHAVGQPLCALAVALPFVLLSWVTRRAFYMELQPGRAAVGGLVFFCALLASVYWIHEAHALTPATAVLAMGGAALLCAAIQLFWLRPARLRSASTLALRSAASEHWTYGRWALAAVLPSWTLLNFYYLALPVRFGLKQAGELKAIMNLAMPATHTVIAFGVLLIPLLVRHLELGGCRLVQRTVRRVTAIFVTGGSAYLILLWFFRFQILRLFYGGRYLQDAGLPVFVLGLAPIATALSVSFGVALRSFERPDRVFWANAVASLVTLSFGLLLAAFWGVLGAAVGYLVSYATLAAALWLFYHKTLLAKLREHSD